MGRLATRLADDGAAAAGLALARERTDTRQALAGLLIGLQCAGRGAVIVDRHHEIVAMNPLAHPFVETLARNCPSRSWIRGSGHCIRDLVEAALHPGRSTDERVAVVDIPAWGRVIVRATDVRSLANNLSDEPRVLIDVTGLGLDNLPTPSFLRRSLGLTATEAEVALALACGATTSVIARDRAISLETVRSHLKTIFAKTGTKRQATLVALVLQLRGVSSPW